MVGRSVCILKDFSAQLQLPEVGIDPAVRKQLGMSAALHNATVFEHDNFIRIDDRRQTMCNDQRGAATRQAVQLVLDGAFRLGVERRGGFVEYQHWRIF
jgi:hypothetical protein